VSRILKSLLTPHLWCVSAIEGPAFQLYTPDTCSVARQVCFDAFDPTMNGDLAAADSFETEDSEEEWAPDLGSQLGELPQAEYLLPRHTLEDACKANLPDVVIQLLCGGASVEGERGRGRRPLSLAASIGAHQCLVHLLRHGANVNASSSEDGSTAAWWAAWRGHASCLKLLLEAKASASASTHDGASCLIMASGAAHEKCVRLLLAKGAALHHVATGLPSDGPGLRCPTALMCACAAGDVNTVALLLDSGADVNQVASSSEATDSPEQHCAMTIACEMGHEEVVRLLIARGAAIDAIGCCLPPVLHASYCYCGAGSTPNPPTCAKAQLALYLLECGADVHGRRCRVQCDMLALACMHGCLHCVKVLAAYGVPIRECHLNLNVRRLGSGAHRLERAYHVGVRSFLLGARRWRPLDHLETFGPRRARQLLRDGADLSAAGLNPRALSPFEMARQLDAKGLVQPGSGAQMVLQASRPWSPSNHGLFPLPARRFASALLLIGARLPVGGLLDIWIGHVMPRLVRRASSLRWGSHPRVLVSLRVSAAVSAPATAASAAVWDIFGDVNASAAVKPPSGLVSLVVTPFSHTTSSRHARLPSPLDKGAPRDGHGDACSAPPTAA